MDAILEIETMNRKVNPKNTAQFPKIKDTSPAGQTPSSGGVKLSWTLLLEHLILAAYAYAFMEWLFFATKPSFMDALPITKKLEVFFLTGLVLAAPALSLFFVLRLLGLLPGPARRRQAFELLAGGIPALLAAALSLLLIDNFTYTVFNFGIVTSAGALRAGYAVLAVALLALWYRHVLRRAAAGPRRKKRAGASISLRLGAALIGVSSAVVLIRIAASGGFSMETNSTSQRRPHIVLLGGDGLDAEDLSVYGYARETTPRLEQLAESGLLAENNFTNAAHTTGSVFSMLTGKYPAETRLLYSPNILRGTDSLEHLPGILQRAGYTTVQIAFPYYIDAYDENLQEGFDVVNGRSLEQGLFFQAARRFHWEEVGYFLPQLWKRVADRLLHAFFLREMPDPYREVIQASDPNKGERLTDMGRIRRLISTLREAEGPVFVHVHLMDTHGPRFHARSSAFSAGEKQNGDWMRDFFDDAILDFDTHVGDFVDDAKALGVWDDTLLILYSDHEHGWQTDARIPLLMHFPGGEYAGGIAANTQNLDIAPTILDYLGMEKPAWMSGQSLLEGGPDALRPILSAGVIGVDCRPPDWWCVIDPDLSRPPFYQFGYLQAVVCQKMYTLNLRDTSFSETDVAGHTAPCPPADLPAPEAVRRLMIEHLRSNGFDVSSLE
jgi:arylsulfatase A-like enzyme